MKVALIKSMSLMLAEQGTAEGNCRRPHPVGSFFEGMVEWWMIFKDHAGAGLL